MFTILATTKLDKIHSNTTITATAPTGKSQVGTDCVRAETAGGEAGAALGVGDFGNDCLSGKVVGIDEGATTGSVGLGDKPKPLASKSFSASS